jgi:hypothetical protein
MQPSSRFDHVLMSSGVSRIVVGMKVLTAHLRPAARYLA